MPQAKDCHTLTAYYKKLYKEHYGAVPRVNEYKARWGFDAVLVSCDMTEAKELLEYYFRTISADHDLTWFFYHYTDLADQKDRDDSDAAEIKILMEQSRRRAEEWNKRLEQS